VGIVTFLPCYHNSNDISLFIGGETIASSLAAAFFYLSRNPDCYEKLATEIRTTFKSGQEISGGPRLSGCRYLRACIDEALRMSPPVPGTLWREVMPSGKNKPLVIDGHFIPPGTQVGVSIYSLHHNEEYFPNSFEFQPERWLSGTKSTGATQAAFTPFSIGPRGCAGKAMAYLETSLVLAKTLWYFDFQRASPVGEKDFGTGGSGAPRGRIVESEFPMYDIFAASHDGPMLKFHPRGSLCDELTNIKM
jgi:cytochrome P450